MIYMSSKTPSSISLIKNTKMSRLFLQLHTIDQSAKNEFSRTKAVTLEHILVLAQVTERSLKRLL
jgi:hypothetical protein